MADDPLEYLIPKSEPVVVGGLRLAMRPSSLVQQRAMARAFKAVQFADLVAHVAPVARAAQDGTLLDAVAEHGAGLLTHIVETVGDHGVGALAEGMGAALDTHENLQALARALPEAEFAAEREYGIHIQCPALRGWVAHSMTTPQLIHALKVYVRVNAWDELGKALMETAESQAPAEEAVAS